MFTHPPCSPSAGVTTGDATTELHGGLAVPKITESQNYRLAATRPTPSAFLPIGRLMSNDSGSLALDPSGFIHGLGSTSQLGVVSTDLLRKRSRKSRGKVSPINNTPNSTPSRTTTDTPATRCHHRCDHHADHYHCDASGSLNHAAAPTALCNAVATAVMLYPR